MFQESPLANISSTTTEVQAVSTITFALKLGPFAYGVDGPSHSDNHPSQFPVNIVPHPGSQHGSHTKWQLLEAIREHWNPNQVEPLTSTGLSPLLEFTERREGIFYCLVPTKTGLCTYKNAKKGRMLSHIRKDHLNFRPFPCIGQCGTQGW